MLVFVALEWSMQSSVSVRFKNMDRTKLLTPTTPFSKTLKKRSM
jgi:hypothetical protein